MGSSSWFSLDSITDLYSSFSLDSIMGSSSSFSLDSIMGSSSWFSLYSIMSLSSSFSLDSIMGLSSWFSLGWYKLFSIVLSNWILDSISISSSVKCSFISSSVKKSNNWYSSTKYSLYTFNPLNCKWGDI